MAKNSLDAYLKDLVQGLVEELPEVSTRRMFGSEAFFANASIFTLVWDGRVAVKLTDPARYEALRARPGAQPWSPNANKPMSAWLLAPEDFHDDPEALRPFLEAAHQSALTRPPAPKKAKLAKKPKSPHEPKRPTRKTAPEKPTGAKRTSGPRRRLT